MACETKILKNITSTCETQPIGGVKSVIYLINKDDIATVTRDNAKKLLVTDITLSGTTVAYKLTGTKKGLKYGSERVVSDEMPDSWTHKLSFQGFEFDSASIDNMDNLGNLVAVVQRNDESVADGAFVILGLGTGLYVSTDIVDSNDSNGVRKIEMATMEGQLEKESMCTLLKTDIATTKALLEALLS